MHGVVADHIAPRPGVGTAPPLVMKTMFTKLHNAGWVRHVGGTSGMKLAVLIAATKALVSAMRMSAS
ncbi:hypothetical protein B4U45_16550 [Mycobacterium persicum]|uniref:Uncharacterized protein n=1 Tax=Mycobacterium persicum TaxID=1487726 RepID=A0A1X0LB60_9MYCO|nr:hypothetical protein A4G31_15565 [Mycobacterium persicum]ORB53638.1 hypothetical protein BST40_07425 [Mycobacterium persicum]ORB90555.1 hypothetical protein B1T49_16415 [Mycobacterium persicum]ORB95952.1 hypothetical protein B1T44_17225 [Mycobacterium persicum]ORC02667.1 hypothetical protein B1T48_16780 [Mycobacterium persicum]